MNNNCGCNDHGQGVVPTNLCCKKKENEPPVKLATVNYPAQYGTDAEGQPYAPEYGKFTNTIVTYAANNARYIYDGQSEYTKIISDDQFNELEAKLTALLNEEAASRAQADEQLQESVDQLEANVNAEASAREAADEALNTRIDEVINSPDVRYIVESYADLEAIDKATVGDQDYARVLVDETHDGQSTFYQFNKTDNAWTYIGAAGAYYTKTEIDAMTQGLEEQIEALGVGGKVGAVVNTYAEAYATTSLNVGQVILVLQDETHNNSLSAYEFMGAPEVDASFFATSTSTPTSEGAFYNTISNPYITVTRSDNITLEAETTELLGGSVTLMNLEVQTEGAYEAAKEKGVTFFVQSTSDAATDLRLRAMNQAGGVYEVLVASTGTYVYVPGSVIPNRGVEVLGPGSGAIQAGATLKAQVYLGEYSGGEIQESLKYIGSTATGGNDTDTVNMSQLNALIARVEALEAKANS